MSGPDSVPNTVLDAYGFSPDHTEAITVGLINTTYRVQGDDGTAIAALQRLHPIFGAEVNVDLEAITDALAAKGMVTPRLLRTRDGACWVMHEGHVWRSITWVDGRCYSKLPDTCLARAGAALVGSFHRALDGLDYEFCFTRSGVHDTPAHFAKLRAADDSNFSEADAAADLRSQILHQATLLPQMPDLPTRICHGDLKISNLLFDDNDQGLCLVDLDTMGQQTIAYELGDALRSWANLGGEDQGGACIDLDVVEEVATGYARGSRGLLSAREIGSVIIGLETICLELAARFCVDVFENCYFGWDSDRYQSRREHNLVRAAGQLALCQSVATNRDVLQARWTSPFSAC